MLDTIDFGGAVWPGEMAHYKYVLDVDGNGWSSRFHRLLSGGSPVVKMTMFPEWHMVCGRSPRNALLITIVAGMAQ